MAKSEQNGEEKVTFLIGATRFGAKLAEIQPVAQDAEKKQGKKGKEVIQMIKKARSLQVL